jgi:hypothetical protein
MQKPDNFEVRINIFAKNVRLLLSPIEELAVGIRANTVPWDICAGWTFFAMIVIVFKIDYLFLSFVGLRNLYPYHPLLFRIYAFCFLTSAFWIWAWAQVKRKRDKLSVLTDAFKNAGLQSRIGRIPQFIADYALDPTIRKMRVTNAGFPLMKFAEQSKFLESELGIFIDEIKEDREKRAIDVIYSHYPMVTEVKYSPTITKRPLEFLVGRTRAQNVFASFRNFPHILVAGQTGGGKSTFLRQLIVHTYLNAKSSRFLLIDLKGGLEFSIFENHSPFTVVPNVRSAVKELKTMNKMLENRMKVLKENKCKDVDAFMRKKDKAENKVSLDRQFVVVDEAAEMFLAGHHAKANEIQEARAILSRIARQGRAVGVHLIVATQRPDSKSLDPQVKANLPGVICFQMINDASSIAVLGNGRATDLPKVPGRAIWKNGIEMLEVQTPFLSEEDATKLLGEPDKKEIKAEEIPDLNSAESAQVPNKEDYRNPEE